MNIKMIVLDMDGTLLNDQLKITPYTAQLLQKIQDKGIILTIASGRSHHMMNDYYEQLNMHGYMVGVNGLELYSFKENKLEKFEAISYQKMVELCGHVFHLGYVPVLMYDDKTLVVEGDDSYASSLLHNKILTEYPGALPNVKIESFQSLAHKSINKMCMIVDKNKVGTVIAQMRKLITDDIHIMQGGSEWIEIMPKQINKAVRIQQIMEKENITSDEIMVFGDSQNDIEMLKLTQNSYAMANAKDDVKRCAKHIALSHNDEGVAREIEKLLK